MHLDDILAEMEIDSGCRKEESYFGLKYRSNLPNIKRDEPSLDTIPSFRILIVVLKPWEEAIPRPMIGTIKCREPCKYSHLPRASLSKIR
jgi:hypothetical protein